MKKEKDIVFCQDNKLYTFLKNNNINPENQELWDSIIHEKFCSHMIKSRKDGITRNCNLRAVMNGLCNRHLPKELKKCKICERNVKEESTYCVYHDEEIMNNKNIMFELPFFKKDICELQYNSIKHLNKKYVRKKISKNVIKDTILPPLPYPDIDELIQLKDDYIPITYKKVIIPNSYYTIKYNNYKYKIDYIYLYKYKWKHKKKFKNNNPPNILYKKKSWKSMLNGIKDFKFTKFEMDNNNIQAFIYKLLDILKYRDHEYLHMNIIELINNYIDENEMEISRDYIIYIDILKNEFQDDKSIISNFYNSSYSCNFCRNKKYENVDDISEIDNINHMLIEEENPICFGIESHIVESGKNNLTENKLDAFEVKPNDPFDNINNIDKYKKMYKNILIEKNNTNKDIYDLIIVLIHFIKIIMNLVDSKILSINIILHYIKRIYFENILKYMKDSKNVDFSDYMKIIIFICDIYEKITYDKIFDSDGIKKGGPFIFK